MVAGESLSVRPQVVNDGTLGSVLFQLAFLLKRTLVGASGCDRDPRTVFLQIIIGWAWAARIGFNTGKVSSSKL
jgi:hypothetical protein